ncbi:hypothetical protein BUALT_Bualt11G0015900 [Buddleja alternifolia]|uniref:VQ domain-containing protein n=1 Tax=Buddleja alternifolia TaxID=168488 RepID=A0AAV6X2K6_9LAMI|nr:hypothetical protein BUALT_Bualt11G0015900 [Buddleja alternifolia]
MDSGNSGSLQSSSGGDEEYDSRAAVDSISNFMTTHQPSNHLRPISAPPPPLFDPLSNYLQLHQNPNPVWPGIQRSDPNPTTLDIMNSPHFFQPPAADNNHGVPPPPQNPNHTAARNPKKRSRASRRAPTTVLTTDTTNFRAMVQEFTGIPAAPFSNSSFPPPYLRRPFAQKVQSPPSFLGSSSSASSLLNSTTALDSSTTQNSNLFNNNIPSPFLASLLQTNPKFIFNKLPDHHHNQGSFEIPPSNDHHHSNIKMDGLDYVTGLPNLISSDPRNDNNNNNNSNAVGPDEGDHRDDYETRMRSVNGGYNFTRNTTSAAAAAASFNGEKLGSETTTRGEGMVESWICSSELK